jgi:hypothetical protein
MRGTKFAAGTEGSIVRDVADRINLLQPDAAPLIAVTSALKRTRTVINPKFEWFEDELTPNTVDSDAAGTGTTINVDAGQGTRVRVNDILIAPNGEALLVTAISTDALTVTRSMGGVAAYSLAATDELVILGTAMAEGSANPTFHYTQKAGKTNYIQIFRDPVELTDVQSMSDSYGGNDRTYLRMKVAIQHKRTMEHAFLFGDGFEDTSGSQTRRGTTGLLNWITTNVTDVGGVITEGEMETIMRSAFRYHPEVAAGVKTAFFSPILISAINAFAKTALQVTTNEKVFGMRIATWRSGHGDLQIIRHWLLRDFAEFQKYGFVIEPANVRQCVLQNGGDTKLHLDTQNKSDAKVLDEYRSYKGMQVEQEKTHAIIKGVTGYAA